MTEPTLQRVRRILSGKLEDAIDRMERQNSESVMAQAIRDVEGALEDTREAHAAATTRRLQAARAQKSFAEKSKEIADKAQFAIGQGREDLAEAALSRQMDFEAHRRQLDNVQAEAREEEDRLAETLAALNERKREMEEALRAFRAVRAEVATGGETKPAPRGVERRVSRAEAAFERAMGGVGFAQADAAAIRGVAELDMMKRKSDLAARMESLKQDVAR